MESHKTGGTELKDLRMTRIILECSTKMVRISSEATAFLLAKGLNLAQTFASIKH